jgi:hypothetical protein
MPSEDIKTDLRQLMMLISDIRSKDNERYEEHIKFSNEVIAFIKNIQENMNTNWAKIQKTLEDLNSSVEKSLDNLLTGISPEGLRETSTALKEIIDTMGRSMQALNLENVMNELRSIASTGLPIASSKSSGSKGSTGSLQSGVSTPYSSSSVGTGSKTTAATTEGDGISESDRQMMEEAKKIYGYVPAHLQPKKTDKKTKGDPHLLKPSDFFGA